MQERQHKANEFRVHPSYAVFVHSGNKLTAFPVNTTFSQTYLASPYGPLQ